MGPIFLSTIFLSIRSVIASLAGAILHQFASEPANMRVAATPMSELGARELDALYLLFCPPFGFNHSRQGAAM